MRKPIKKRILTIPKPTKEQIFEKYECCLNDIKRYLEIEDFTPEERFALIKYSVAIAFDDNIRICKFKNIEIKNAGDTVHIDTGFWNQKGEYIEDIQEVDLEKE